MLYAVSGHILGSFYGHIVATILSTFVILSTFFIDWYPSVPLEMQKTSFGCPSVHLGWPRGYQSMKKLKNGSNLIWLNSQTLG